MFHFADLADVMDFAWKVSPTTTLAFAGIEPFNQFRAAENKLREWRNVDVAPFPGSLSQILQAKQLDRPLFIPDLEANVEVLALSQSPENGAR